MNRKEFLQASALLLPASAWGMTHASTQENSANMQENYLASPSYLKSSQRLKFNANGKFKIVQFTDVHWAPGNAASKVAAERIAEVLDAEKPDFVEFTGDIIWGKPGIESLKRTFAPVVERDIPFAMTFGNHDDEQDLSRKDIHEQLKNFAGNLNGTVEGLSGVSNFILPVRSSDGSKDAFILYHFDSHAYSQMKEQVDGYDWIKADQIAWYRSCSDELKAKNGGKALPALAFFHIPLPEYNYAAQQENALLIGIRKEAACAPKINSGLFTAMLEKGDVMGTFVGHDHVNDYVTTWKGILLGYGRYTGGKTVYCDIPWGNGARVIELTEGKRELDSWVRLKDGRIESRIHYPTDFSKEPW